MRKILIPDKKYYINAQKILESGDINIMKNTFSYYRLNEKLFTSENLKNLLESNNIIERLKISSGTSDRYAFEGFIKQSIKDLKNGIYYRFYTPPKGNLIARKTLAYMESLKLRNALYTENDICMTEGSTGAITMVFEYIKRNYKQPEILLVGPTYYLYKFTADYYNLPIKEIISVNSRKPFAFDISLFKKNITSNTKLIVFVRPSNPIGEIYSEEIMKSILMIAKKKNIFVLIDELFYELIFDKNSVVESDVIAEKENALYNIILVKGYSKNKNLAAFRIGYILSKNTDLINSVAFIAEQRQCFANAQNYTGVICIDAFIQSVNTLVNQKMIMQNAILRVKKGLYFSPAIIEKTNNELIKLYINYQKYFSQKMKFYSDSYDSALKILKDDIEISPSKITAFNTLVKIKGLENVNYFDFCFNLFLTSGVESQIGPCFAFDQNTWQKNKDLGFWLRISFSRDPKIFLNGIQKFKEFKKIYLENQDKFLRTDLLF